MKIVAFIVVILFATSTQAEEKKKLHPEFSDPVLGERAAVVEWAWSPQYAERFNLPVQKDGLKNGPLWLLGIKVHRKQYQEYQNYQCSIVGLIENRTPILTPPGERFVSHPINQWMGEIPGMPMAADMSFMVQGKALQDYTPYQAAWWKPGRKKPEPSLPKSDISTDYIFFHRYYLPDLAFFELDGGCSYFEDPEKFRNEIRFPAKDKDPKGNSPLTRSHPLAFDMPDDLMRRVYPYTDEAASWTQCLMRRIGGKSNSLRIGDNKRFGNTCEPITGNIR